MPATILYTVYLDLYQLKYNILQSGHLTLVSGQASQKFRMTKAVCVKYVSTRV